MFPCVLRPPPMTVRATLLALGLGGVVSACEGDSTQVEARSLLGLLESMAVEGTLAERGEQVSRLRALKLRDPSLRATRDACLTAHGRLLEAELLQAELRAELKRQGRTGGGQPGQPGQVGPGGGKSLAARHVASETALQVARAALPQCRSLSRALLERIR